MARERLPWLVAQRHTHIRVTLVRVYVKTRAGVSISHRPAVVPLPRRRCVLFGGLLSLSLSLTTLPHLSIPAIFHHLDAEDTTRGCRSRYSCIKVKMRRQFLLCVRARANRRRTFRQWLVHSSDVSGIFHPRLLFARSVSHLINSLKFMMESDNEYGNNNNRRQCHVYIAFFMLQN